MQKPILDPMTDPDLAQATARLRALHRQETSPLQLAVDRLTAVLGWPGFVAALTAAIVLWTLANGLARNLGVRAPDPPPFLWLQGAIGTGALYVAALILTTQRREGLLASHRSQLILELAILSDQKTSKIIELIEEVRRDNPLIGDRIDDQAQDMSTPLNHVAMLGAIKSSEESGA